MNLKKLIILIAVTGCGVKGDPIPPKDSAHLGRGEPTYHGATEDLKFLSVPPVYAPKTQDKESDEEKKAD